MDTETFKAAYNESRNGVNTWFRHPFNHNFHYSDGVQELAEAGCYWLLDVLATEVDQVMRSAVVPAFGVLTVSVADDARGHPDLRPVRRRPVGLGP